MEKNELNKLRYPVGKFSAPNVYDSAFRKECISALKELPSNINKVSESLTDVQLDTPYRESGWTSRQIIHHLADSHMNSFIRFKLALNEDNPTIKPYDQDAWANNEDSKSPISSSLAILEGVHQRLVDVLTNMSEADFNRTLHHPEMSRELTLDFMAGLYAWHSKHHTMQIVKLKERQGW